MGRTEIEAMSYKNGKNLKETIQITDQRELWIVKCGSGELKNDSEEMIGRWVKIDRKYGRKQARQRKREDLRKDMRRLCKHRQHMCSVSIVPSLVQHHLLIRLEVPEREDSKRECRWLSASIPFSLPSS